MVHSNFHPVNEHFHLLILFRFFSKDRNNNKREFLLIDSSLKPYDFVCYTNK